MDLNEERHNAGGVIIQKPRFLNGQRGHVPTATRDHGTVDPSLCRESGRRRTFEKGQVLKYSLKRSSGWRRCGILQVLQVLYHQLRPNYHAWAFVLSLSQSSSIKGLHLSFLSKLKHHTNRTIIGKNCSSFLFPIAYTCM